jgi:hypothetical protein
MFGCPQNRGNFNVPDRELTLGRVPGLRKAIQHRLFAQPRKIQHDLRQSATTIRVIYVMIDLELDSRRPIANSRKESIDVLFGHSKFLDGRHDERCWDRLPCANE